MDDLLDRTANTDAPILPLLSERWSTRIFDAEQPIDEAALASALEAARWAPSAANTQPWRVAVVRRGSEGFQRVVDSLTGFNPLWATDAAAFVVFIAEVERDGVEMRWAQYDTGQAAAHFTVQAHASGLMTHQMGGFDAAALVDAFNLPSTTRPVTVMAVGYHGDVEAAPQQVREREAMPRTRRPLSDTVLVND